MAAVLTLVLLLIAPSSHAAPRKNVLWIYLEDVSGWFSCYGETLIKTPHIDALADSGIRLERFYTPAGVCSATRSAIVTGMMQTSIGAHHHRSGRASFRGQDLGPGFDDIRLPQGVSTLPEIFRAAGYWTFNEGGKDDYNFKHDTGQMYDFIPKGRGIAPASLVSGDCWKGRKKGQPFFGQVQLKGGKLGRNAKKVTDRSKVQVPPYYPDTALVREEIAHHFDCLLKTDEQVGNVVAALKRDGLYKDTVIFMFSDHGYKLHRHKQYLYEGGIQMPCTVSGPGIPAGKVREDLVSGIDVSAASLVVAGIALPEKMEGRNFLAKDYQSREYLIAARDRCDYTYERIRAVVTPRFKYLRNYLTDRPFMNPSYKDPWPVSREMRRLMAEGRMNETQLIFFGDKKPDEELYDLANDPHEIHNLAGMKPFSGELERHRKILAEWIASSGDQGQEVESDAGLLAAMKRWGEKCVNPEYDRVRSAYKKWKASRPVQPKPAPRKKGSGGKKKKTP
ncbi:MAG: sulfatase [Verrucomicrobiaceae bacterium]|nr:sulfatase [Verrucomicrobiaceae bacterium]